jgi:hypothetical protein
MKKILISVAAGIGVALVLYKLAESGKLDCISEDLSKKTGKAKQKIKSGIGEKKQQISDIVNEVEEKVLDKLKRAKS